LASLFRFFELSTCTRTSKPPVSTQTHSPSKAAKEVCNQTRQAVWLHKQTLSWHVVDKLTNFHFTRDSSSIDSRSLQRTKAMPLSPEKGLACYKRGTRGHATKSCPDCNLCIYCKEQDHTKFNCAKVPTSIRRWQQRKPCYKDSVKNHGVHRRLDH
jgi:hypothetical protein